MANIQNGTKVVTDDVQHLGENRFNSDKFTIVDPTDATKSVIFNLSGLPTNTETEFTVPDSDSSLVTLTATQSLTNKSMDDTTTKFFDTASITKLGRFELSGVTAGQTRVLTWPDYNGTLATLAGTETLTNKTLTTPVIAAITSPTDIDLSPTTALTGSVGASINFTAGAYMSLSTTAGDATLATAGTGDKVILSAATAGGKVRVNGGLMIDRLAVTADGNADYKAIIGVAASSESIELGLLDANKAAGGIYIIKDEAGNAATHNTVITPQTGTIDGAASLTISTNYGIARLYSNGTNYFTW